MKKVILFAIIALTFNACIAQKTANKRDNQQVSEDISFITNEKIEYLAMLTLCDTCAIITNGGFKVIIRLSEKEEGTVRRVTNKTWLKLLKNPKTDWAANLMLYYVFRRNAILYYPKMTMKEWFLYLREDDLKYWKNKLSTS